MAVAVISFVRPCAAADDNRGARRGQEPVHVGLDPSTADTAGQGIEVECEGVTGVAGWERNNVCTGRRAEADDERDNPRNCAGQPTIRPKFHPDPLLFEKSLFDLSANRISYCKFDANM